MDSVGTVYVAGIGAKTLFEYLTETRRPFIFSGGKQKRDRMPQDVLDMLDKAEKDGLALNLDWVDQVLLLSHPVRNLPFFPVSYIST